MLELNKLYNMDCMEGMKEFPDKFFDLAVVDPPYGLSVTQRHTKVNSCLLVGGGGDRSEVCTLKAPSKSAKCRLNFITRSMIAPHRTRTILRS